MKLIGNYLSPYVRRVAISLNLLEIPFELHRLMVFEEPDTVRAHNPVVRIPTLVLDDGSSLVESFAILDYIDQLVGPDRALVPPSGEARRTVMQIVAIAVGATEKAQWAAYEARFHPPEKVHQPWIEHNEGQVVGGLEHLDRLATAAGDGWLGGTAQLGQADVTAAVAFSFTQTVRPGLDVASKVPALASFTARCEALDTFSNAPLPPPPS